MKIMFTQILFYVLIKSLSMFRLKAVTFYFEFNHINIKLSTNAFWLTIDC